MSTREEVQRRRLLATHRAVELLADLYRTRTDEEKQDAAKALGVEHWLPEPRTAKAAAA